MILLSNGVYDLLLCHYRNLNVRSAKAKANYVSNNINQAYGLTQQQRSLYRPGSQCDPDLSAQQLLIPKMLT